MKLSDLLQHTRDHSLRDKAVPPIFPDSLVVAYLSEGQQKLAVRTHSLIAATREISLEALEDTYTMDADIVFVYSVRLDGYAGRLSPSTEGWTPENDSAARPTRYTTDKETQTMRFFNIPDQAYTAVLRVAVLPATLSVDDLDADLQLKDQYQLAVADYAAYKCFSTPDADGFSPGEADRALGRFNIAVNELKRDEYRLRTGFNARVHGQRVK